MEGGGVAGLSQWVQLCTGAQMNFRDLTPYLTYDPQLWSGVSARALSGPLGARRGLEKRSLTLGHQLAGRTAVWPPLSRGNTQLAHSAGAEGSSMQLALAGGFGTSMKAGKQLGEVKARPQVNRSRQHGKGNSGSGTSRSRKSRPGNSASGNSAPGNSAPGSSAPGNSLALGEGANGRGLNSGEDSSTQSSQSKAGWSDAIHSATVSPWSGVPDP